MMLMHPGERPDAVAQPGTGEADEPSGVLGALRETFNDGAGARAFAPIAAGAYTVSIQASGTHRWCIPKEAAPPEEVVGWEVFITDARGAAVGPGTHPWLFRRRPWVFHWLNADPEEEVPVGRFVPTHVLQQLVDFLAAASRAAPASTGST